MKRILALALALCMIFALCACGKKAETSDPAQVAAAAAETQQTATEKSYKSTVVVAPDLEFTGVDVQGEKGSFTKSVFLTVMNTLIEYDTAEGKLIPGLATEWTQKDDTTWELKLREGVKFHDGTDFTAEDVKFTLERAKDGAMSKSLVSNIDHVDVIDDHTVDVVLSKIDGDIIYKFTEPNLCILSKNAFDTLSEEQANMIGTGPFKYEDWVQGDHVTLARFDEYWGGAAKTEKIVVQTIPEASSRLVALQSGEVDYCVNPPEIDLHYIEEDGNLVLYRVLSSNIRYITVNIDCKPFDNELVRQAVAHAISRDDMIAAVYEGNATPAFNAVHPQTMGYKEVKYYDYDVELAKSLLAEAGYPDGFKTEIYCSNGTIQKAVATVLQAELAEIGIEAEIQALDTATFNAGILHGGTYPLGVMGYGGYFTGPDNAMRKLFYSTASMNFSNLNDAHIDELLDAALAEKDEAKRVELYGELQDYVATLATWLPIAIEETNIGVNANLEGYEEPFGVFHHLRNLAVVEG